MKRKDGFTFIEVALVLAIAALIFLMAFLALPSLWMSQRDADRKARVMEFISDIKTYQTNNSRGALPTLKGDEESFTTKMARNTNNEDTQSWGAFVRDYVAPDFEDATGEHYYFYITTCLDNDGKDSLGVGSDCLFGKSKTYESEDDGKSRTANGLNAVNTKLDNPTDNTLYVIIGATCDGDHAVKTNSRRSVAAMQVLERAGRYCYNT